MKWERCLNKRRARIRKRRRESSTSLPGSTKSWCSDIATRCGATTPRTAFRTRMLGTPMSESRTTLYLERHFFAGPTKRHWGFLDVNRDKYLCLNRLEFDCLGSRLKGFTEARQTLSNISPASLADLVSLENELIKAGILTTNIEHSNAVTRVDVPAPSRILQKLSRPLTKGRVISRLPAFMYGCWKADRGLRENPFYKTIGDLVRRKQPARPTHIQQRSRRIMQSVCAFNSLRLLYPRPYLCLFDSLALFEMLSLHGDFPTLVFGVTTDPFHAHCWLQDENTVLNDSPSTVRSYTPIM